MKYIKLFENFDKDNWITVYHGTDSKFEEFDLDKTSEGDIWFTDNKESITKGESGAASSKYIMTRQINLKNPAGWDEYEKYSLQQLREKGFDGVKLPDSDKIDYIVFDIKSIRKVK